MGIDAGQTATKVALFDLAGHQVAVGSSRGVVLAPHPRWQERELGPLWDQVVGAVRDCLHRADIEPRQILGIGLCGHGDGAYLLDAAGQPVRAAIMATDSRAHNYVEEYALDPVAARALELTGQVPFAGSPAALFSWLRDNEPASFEAIRWALFCKDWIRWGLTGRIATDPTEASASFARVSDARWDPAALELYGLAELSDALPPILASTATDGAITPSAAVATGLEAGTPVVVGAHDVDAAAVGIGATQTGALSLVMGTFSINQVVADRPVNDPRWQARAFVRPAHWLHMSTSPAGSTNLDWAVRLLGPHNDRGEPDFAAAAAEAGGRLTARAMADPYFLPFLYGSPHGSDVAAGFAGLRGWHDRADLLAAVMEGVVFNHRTHVSALREAFEVVGAARVCGGGSGDPGWCDLLADALALPIEVTDAQEAGARGAAMLAGIGVGAYPDIDAAVAAAVRVARRHDPQPGRNDHLDQRYADYRELVEAHVSHGHRVAARESAPSPASPGAAETARDPLEAG